MQVTVAEWPHDIIGVLAIFALAALGGVAVLIRWAWRRQDKVDGGITANQAIAEATRRTAEATRQAVVDLHTTVEKQLDAERRQRQADIDAERQRCQRDQRELELRLLTGPKRGRWW